MPQNTLLKNWETRFGLPPFDAISDDDFLPAIDAALEGSMNNYRRIGDSTDPADFDSVIIPLELADEALQRVCLVFANLVATDSNPQRREIEKAAAPKLAEFRADVAMNGRLFKRLESVWNQRDSLPLSDEQRMALKRHYQGFIRSGANLKAADKDRFREIRSKLALLAAEFMQHVLADEADWHMPLSAEDAAGLPEFLLRAAAQAAADRNLQGQVVTLDRSLVVPFLQHCPNRSLRRRAFAAWCGRGANGNANDTRQIVAEMIGLRAEMAALLGYGSFSAWQLEDKMAKTPEAARKLLSDIWQPARARALKDADRYAAALRADGEAGDLQAWDWRYYAEKQKRAEHDLDETVIKQYFQLDRLREAAFEVAGRLFGLEFQEVDCALYHPDCRAWEVNKGGRHIAVFIADDFARPAKRSGAWCSSFREQRRLVSEVRPLVVNVCNFMKAADGEPCLLSFDDARTLFHEFGHALHAMLSDITYPSLSSFNVALDFVELPSQLFENWLETAEVLDRFAIHADTGEPLPAALRDRIVAARNFDQGFDTVEYLACAFVDLDMHSADAAADPMEQQAETLAAIGMPQAIRMRHETPHFLHLFATEGYAAGYYSYLWADVIVADAFSAFLESNGPYCRATAERLERCILAAGGSREPEELYALFRGKLPGPEALLRKRGLDSEMSVP